MIVRTPFVTLKTRGELGRVNFRKFVGLLSGSGEKYSQYPVAWRVPPLTIPETIAGHISEPVAFSLIGKFVSVISPLLAFADNQSDFVFLKFKYILYYLTEMLFLFNKYLGYRILNF